MLSLTVSARTMGFPNSTKKMTSFIYNMPKGSCIMNLDNEVKNKLKDELDGGGDSFVVGYMITPHKGQPYKVERDGKQCISDIFSPIPPTNKLKVSAIVSAAATGQGPVQDGSNNLFAARGSRRRATADANIGIAMTNDVHNYQIGKKRRDAKIFAAKKAEKAKKSRSNQPAEKRPHLKGLGRKLCDSTPPANSSDEDELGEELSDVEDADELDAEIINPDSYNPMMGKNNVAQEGVGFIDGLPSNKELKRTVNKSIPIQQQDDMNEGALAQIFHGHYEINQLTNQVADEKHGRGRVLSGGGGGDQSKFMEIIWSPVIGSVKDVAAENRSGNSHMQVLQIMEDDELKMAMEDLMEVAIENKMMFVFRPDILISRIPHLFWNVVYRAQPKVKPNEARMQFHEMLRKVKPEVDWEFLRTS